VKPQTYVMHSFGIPPDSDGSRTKVTGRHRIVPEQAAECAITILDIPVHSGWYLSMRSLHVEKARTYSK